MTSGIGIVSAGGSRGDFHRVPRALNLPMGCRGCTIAGIARVSRGDADHGGYGISDKTADIAPQDYRPTAGNEIESNCIADLNIAIVEASIARIPGGGPPNRVSAADFVGLR